MKSAGEQPPKPKGAKAEKSAKPEKFTRKIAEKFVIDKIHEQFPDPKNAGQTINLLEQVRRAYREAQDATEAVRKISLFKNNPLIQEVLRLRELKEVIEHLASKAKWDEDWRIPTKRYLHPGEVKPKPKLTTAVKDAIVGEDPRKTMDKKDYEELINALRTHAVFQSDLSHGTDNAFLDSYPELVHVMPHTQPRAKRLRQEQEARMKELFGEDSPHHIEDEQEVTGKEAITTDTPAPPPEETPTTDDFLDSSLTSEDQEWFFGSEEQFEYGIDDTDLPTLEEAQAEYLRLRHEYLHNRLPGDHQYRELKKALATYIYVRYQVTKDKSQYERELDQALYILYDLQISRSYLATKENAARVERDTSREKKKPFPFARAALIAISILGVGTASVVAIKARTEAEAHVLADREAQRAAGLTDPIPVVSSDTPRLSFDTLAQEAMQESTSDSALSQDLPEEGEPIP